VRSNRARSSFVHCAARRGFLGVPGRAGRRRRGPAHPHAARRQRGRGGLPLVVDGKVVGGIGASGGSAEQDGAVAKAGADALAAK